MIALYLYLKMAFENAHKNKGPYMTQIEEIMRLINEYKYMR